MVKCFTIFVWLVYRLLTTQSPARFVSFFTNMVLNVSTTTHLGQFVFVHRKFFTIFSHNNNWSFVKQSFIKYICGNHKWRNVRHGNERTEPGGKETHHCTKRNTSSSNKRLTCNTIIKSMITHSCEMWSIKGTMKPMLEAPEMNFWWRVTERSRLERVTNCASNAYDNGWNKEQTTHISWTCAKNVRNSNSETNYELETSTEEKTWKTEKLRGGHRQNSAEKELGRWWGETGKNGELASEDVSRYKMIIIKQSLMVRL